jgi:hypothetical protein
MRCACMALVLSLTAAIANAQTPAEPAGSDGSGGLFSEPHVIGQGVGLANRFLGENEGTPKDGFYPDFGNMITGSGWISAGPGYRRRFLNDHALVDGSAAVSWREYRIAQGRFEVNDLANHRLTLGSQVFWQDLTQIDYFGIGSGSLEGLRSEYQMKDTDVIGYGTVQANRWLAIDGTFGWLRHPELSSPSGWFARSLPNALGTFPTDPGVTAQPNFLHGTVSVTADTRDHKGYARRGGVYRASASAYSDRDYGPYSYRRYELEGVQYVPVTSDTWTLAFHGWGVFSDTSAGNKVPFYMLPSLGGQNTLRGYYDYRFHDRNMLVASAESRWALFSHVDAAAFFDAGNVSPTVSGLDLRKTSWGGGLRVHTPMSTLTRLDIAHSVEGWQFVFRLNDPFRLARLSRRIATTPYVP